MHVLASGGLIDAAEKLPAWISALIGVGLIVVAVVAHIVEKQLDKRSPDGDGGCLMSIVELVFAIAGVMILVNAIFGS